MCILGPMKVQLLIFGGVALLLGCGDEPANPPAATYEAVEAVIVNRCATNAAACHGGMGDGGGGLNFGQRINAGEPITLALNGVQACQYDRMPLVTPGNPDESWLMVKLAHEFDSEGNIIGFSPDPAWDHGLTPDDDGRLPPSACPLTDDGVISFGTNMPQIRGNPTPLEAENIDLIRRWIAAGAPGPSGASPDAG